MSASLTPATAAFGEALRALQRALDDSRGAWDDSARQNFDRRYADRIVGDGKRALSELQNLAREVDTASRMLASLR